MRKSAFITGATGYTGGFLLRRLIQDGWGVKALVRDARGKNSLTLPGCQPVYGDLTDRESLISGMTGCDVVFHLAAIYRTEVSREQFQRVNVQGTQNVLDACVKNRIKNLIHCSTVGVHGEITNPPADESAPFNPDDDYQQSKLDAEKRVRAYIDQNRISGTIFRPAGIYGPGEMRFLKLFRLVKAPLTIVPGSGDTLYHFTYIDDLVDGIMLCADKKEATGETFILAGDTVYPLKEVISIIADVLKTPLRPVHVPLKLMYSAAALNEGLTKVTGIKPFLYKRRLDFFTKGRAFNINKAKQILGYSPRISLPEGMQVAAKWYQQNNLI